MATILQQCARVSQNIGAGNTRYGFWGSGCSSIFDMSTEPRALTRTRIGGIVSMLYINVLTNDRAASTLRFRKNSVSGNQVVLIPAATTGEFEDSVNTDSVLSGDDLNLRMDSGAGGTTLTWTVTSTLFNSSLLTTQRNLFLKAGTVSTGEFFPISGGPPGTVEANNQVKIYGNGGTFKNGFLNVVANTRDGDSTFRTRKNGANGNIVVTVPASTTGIFEDIVNTDAVVNGDLYCWTVSIAGALGTMSDIRIAVSFETTNNTFLLVSADDLAVANNLTVYIPFPGQSVATSATESNTQGDARTPFTVSNLTIYISANTLADNSTLRLRKNAANGNLVVSITAATTGRFEDIVNSDAFIFTDTINLQLITGATGTSLTYQTMNALGSAPSTTNNYLPIMGIGS